jgi:hypothetical protein
MLDEKKRSPHSKLLVTGQTTAKPFESCAGLLHLEITIIICCLWRHALLLKPAHNVTVRQVILHILSDKNCSENHEFQQNKVMTMRRAQVKSVEDVCLKISSDNQTFGFCAMRCTVKLLQSASSQPLLIVFVSRVANYRIKLINLVSPLHVFEVAS